MNKPLAKIKLALQICSEICPSVSACKACPYDEECRRDHKEKDIVPGSAMMRDALVCIEQFEQVAKDINVHRWVSVNDRYPEDNVNVIVFARGIGDNVNNTAMAITSYTHNMYGYNIEGWCNPWQYFHYGYKITHWMPLPMPPEEE